LFGFCSNLYFHFATRFLPLQKKDFDGRVENRSQKSRVEGCTMDVLADILGFVVTKIRAFGKMAGQRISFNFVCC